MMNILSVCALISTALALNVNSPAPQNASGVIQIVNGASISYVAGTLTYGTYGSTTDKAKALVVTLPTTTCTPTSPEYLKLPSTSLEGYGLLGGCVFPYAQDASSSPSGGLVRAVGIATDNTASIGPDCVAEATVWQRNCATSELTMTWTDREGALVPLAALLYTNSQFAIPYTRLEFAGDGPYYHTSQTPHGSGRTLDLVNLIFVPNLV